ncbi:MAG TPA: GatB/YqeY domain-containing protein [Solirubrobacterales bacterium]|nr:GatB/YqeY domain-containing protein [Solirubrobacterales bacterium]
MSEPTLEQIQADTKEAMRAGDRQRTAALRMIADAVQKAAKEGDGDAVSVLQKERKKRLEAADAFANGGREEAAESERAEAEMIAAYLPAELSDDELAELVGEAIAATGAEGPQAMGQVMGAVMPKVQGRADGNRVSAAVRERLGA